MEKICGIEKFLLDGEEIEEKKVKINNTGGIYNITIIM